MTDPLRSIFFTTSDRSTDVRVETSFASPGAAYLELGDEYAWFSPEETAKLHAALTNILAGREVGEPAPVDEEPTPDTLDAGTRVRILPGGFYRTDWMGEVPLGSDLDNAIGTVEAGPDDDGDYFLVLPDGGHQHVAPECLELAPVEPEPVFAAFEDVLPLGLRHSSGGCHGSRSFCQVDVDPADFTTPVYLPEPEPTFTAAVGDRVVLKPSSWAYAENAGRVFVVKERDGRHPWIAREDGERVPAFGSTIAQLCENDEHLEPAPAPAPAPAPSYVPTKGDRVRILAATTRSGHRSIPAGTVGVVRLVGSDSGSVYVRPLGGAPGFGYMLNHGDVEPLTFAVGDRVVRNAEPHRFTSAVDGSVRRSLNPARLGTVGTVFATHDDGDLGVEWDTGRGQYLIRPEAVDPAPAAETMPDWERALWGYAPRYVAGVEEPKAPEPLKVGDRVRTVRAGESQTGYSFPKGATAKVVTIGDDLQAGTGIRWATRQAWANVTFDDAEIGGTTVRLADLELAPVEEPLKVGDRVRVTGNDGSNPDGKHCYSIGDVVNVDRLGGLGLDGEGSRRSVVVRGWRGRQGVLVSDLEKIEEPKAPRAFQRGDRVIVTESHEDEDAGDRYLYPAGRIGTVDRVGRFDPSRVIVNFDDGDKLADYPFAEKLVAFEPLTRGAVPARGTKLVRISDEGGALDVRPLGSVEEVAEVERDGFIRLPGAALGGLYSHRFGRVLS